MNQDTTAAVAPHALPPLPYPENALAPVISANTLGFHYGKHHRGYADNLNKLMTGRAFADLPLRTIINDAAGEADNVTIS